MSMPPLQVTGIPRPTAAPASGAGKGSCGSSIHIPEIVRQIKGAGEAFFEADWKEGVEDQDW
jgi:hypothetical protein